MKQSEIEAALKHFISSQGINLTGKIVEIAFTAGRKENGLTAEMQIEESGDIPGFTDYVAPVALKAVPTAREEAPAPAPAEPEPERAQPRPLTFNESEPVIPKETAPPTTKAANLFI